ALQAAERTANASRLERSPNFAVLRISPLAISQLRALPAPMPILVAQRRQCFLSNVDQRQPTVAKPEKKSASEDFLRFTISRILHGALRFSGMPDSHLYNS